MLDLPNFAPVFCWALRKTMQRNILITGGAGFIGGHVVGRFVKNYPEYNIVNLDALTYAGNLENLKPVEGASNYTFVKGDINDGALLDELFARHNINAVIHLAAESHVDRSITDPVAFVRTNVLGSVSLLNAARQYWKDKENCLFYHVSTDEVYGTLGETGLFTEQTAYDPRSPYSASKASSDHFVRAYHHTYGLPVVLSNCSNNYGPYQFPEKLIPLIINNIQHRRPLPIYGDGKYTRDWLWVGDHAAAIDVVFHKGEIGETYNIGGHNEWQNIALVEMICDLMDKHMGNPMGASRELITFIKDRPGHDRRYAIDASKIANDLGWSPAVQTKEGLDMTIEWYLRNQKWLENITSGKYQEYYEKQYKTA
jgi:dTDP-glucose 4,6-dehydratase